MLGLLGGGAGVLIATWAISIVGGLIPGDVPGIDRLAIDWRVLGVALALSLGAAVLFGTAPAWRASRVDAGDVVRESSLRVAGSRRVGRARGVLVAGQLALSLGLVAGAALAAQSFATLARLEPGFEPAGVITAKIQLSDRYPDHKSRAAFYGPLLDRLSALPGVDSAGLVLLRPLADPIGWDYPFTVEGQTPEAQARNPHANYESISPNYFSTMKIPLVDGRIFNNADGPDAGPGRHRVGVDGAPFLARPERHRQAAEGRSARQQAAVEDGRRRRRRRALPRVDRRAGGLLRAVHAMELRPDGSGGARAGARTRWAVVPPSAPPFATPIRRSRWPRFRR